jgi:hypothetical protein
MLPAMARQAHAGQGEAEAPTDLQVDDGERDGDARAPVEHLVEEAVAGILVLAFIADEPQLIE